MDAPKLDYLPVDPPGFGLPVPVSDGIRWVRLPLPFKPYHVNVYLLKEQDGYSLIDTGFDTVRSRFLWQSLKKQNLKISKILVTHFHPDHLGLAEFLSDLNSDANIFIPQKEWNTALRTYDATDQQMLLSFGDFFRLHGADSDLAMRFLSDGNRYRKSIPNFPNRERVNYIDKTDVCVTRAGTYNVTFIGGHSPAHAVLFKPSPPVLIAGDILLPTTTPNISVWPSGPNANPLNDYFAGLRNLSSLPDDCLVLPAHGNPFLNPRTRCDQLLNHHSRKLDRLRGEGGRPVTALEAVPKIFRAKIPGPNLPFALGETIAHLNYLWHQGEMVRHNTTRGHLVYSSHLG